MTEQESYDAGVQFGMEFAAGLCEKMPALLEAENAYPEYGEHWLESCSKDYAKWIRESAKSLAKLQTKDDP